MLYTSSASPYSGQLHSVVEIHRIKEETSLSQLSLRHIKFLHFQRNTPQMRMWLMAPKCGHYSLKVVDLSETHFSEERQMKIAGTSYTFFWSSHPKETCHETGISFAIQNQIVNQVSTFPKGISGGLMIPRLPLSGKPYVYVVLLHVYASIMIQKNDIKVKFQDDVYFALDNVPRSNKLIIPAYFNTQYTDD